MLPVVPRAWLLLCWSYTSANIVPKFHRPSESESDRSLAFILMSSSATNQQPSLLRQIVPCAIKLMPLYRWCNKFLTYIVREAERLRYVGYAIFSILWRIVGIGVTDP